MSRFTTQTMSRPEVLYALNEMARDHQELRDPEAMEDFVNFARDCLPRIAQGASTKDFTPLQGLKRAFERWTYRRSHPELAYAQTIREIAEGRIGRDREEDLEPEPDVRGPHGESADVVSEEQHERESGEAIDWLRQRRAGQPGYGREITDEQRERIQAGIDLQARRRANGA